MKRLLLMLAVGSITTIVARADAQLLSADQIDDLDRKGFLTPAFKSAARELIAARQDQRDAAAEKTHFTALLPDLQKAADREKEKVDALKKDLAKYAHPDENDFTELQDKMKDSGSKPEERMALAQAYVWTYPASPHQAQAQMDLEQAQKTISNEAESVKETDAAHQAAQMKLLQRVKAKDLSLEEWRAFLQDKTRLEVSEYLGQPTMADSDYWTYLGAWTIDPTTKMKSGLQLTFNGGHVQNVTSVPVK